MMCTDYTAVTANDHGEQDMVYRSNQSSDLSLQQHSTAMGKIHPLHSNDYDYKDPSILSSPPDDRRSILKQSRDRSARSVIFDGDFPGSNGFCDDFDNSQEVTVYVYTEHTKNLEVDQNEAMRFAATSYRRRSSTSRPFRRLAMGRTSTRFGNRLVNSISYYQI